MLAHDHAGELSCRTTQLPDDAARQVVADVVDSGLPARIGTVVVDCDGTSILVGTQGARVEAVSLDRDGVQLWSIEIRHEGEITSNEALAIATADDHIAVIGWADLVADDPGVAPWVALLEPS